MSRDFLAVQDRLLQFWSTPPERLISSLETTPEGISETDAQERLKQYGLNLLKSSERTATLLLFFKQFKSPIMIILLITTLVSAVLHDWTDSVIILIIVLGSSILTFAQEYKSTKAIARLQAQISLKCKTLRDGNVKEVPLSGIVPGDVVVLSPGDLIPADCVLLESKDLAVDQAVLTGETFPADKSTGVSAAQSAVAERKNCVFMGTSVRSGNGRALVVTTGVKDHLQSRWLLPSSFEALKAKPITITTGIAGGFETAVNTIYGQISGRLALRPPETEFERGVRRFGFLLSRIMMILILIVFAINVYLHKPVLDSLLFSIALAVGLTPQLLPAIISINLSKGAQYMADQGVIVRRLTSIENFGSMDILCTDKTGTLTEGVVKLDAAVDGDGEPSNSVFYHAYLNASLQSGVGNPLDQAILVKEPPKIEGVKKLDEIPYDFVCKRLSVVIDEGAGPFLVTKGALENVVAVCSRVKRKDGTSVPLERGLELDIGRRYTEWSQQGFRVLGVAVKLMLEQEKYSREDEEELVFIGFLLFFDPPKPGVRETVADLAALGVELKVITGDNRYVALHVAEAVGLEIEGVISGSELNDLRDEALWNLVEKTGHVVGYMGDGINDAPALHDADVGISVEKAVDVAKEAADFVLVKRDLSVLHQGIILGRSTFANTLKYVFITTSANFGNMASVAGASLFLPFLPLLPMQILLINFLTDFPAITLAGDRVDPEWTAKPHRWSIDYIRKFMVTFGLLSSVFDYLTFGALLLLLHASTIGFRSGWFIESILTELLVLLIMRTRGWFLKSTPSRSLAISVLLVGLIAVAIPFSPMAGFLGFAPLPISFIAVLIVITVLYVGASEWAKRIFYRITPTE